MYHPPVSINTKRKCNGCDQKKPTKTFELTMKPAQYRKQDHPLVMNMRLDLSVPQLICKVFRAQLCQNCEHIVGNFKSKKHIKRDEHNWGMNPWDRQEEDLVEV